MTANDGIQTTDPQAVQARRNNGPSRFIPIAFSGVVSPVVEFCVLAVLRPLFAARTEPAGSVEKRGNATPRTPETKYGKTTEKAEHGGEMMNGCP